MLFGLLIFATANAGQYDTCDDCVPHRIDPDTYRCEDYLPKRRYGNTEWDTMELEHCDRIKRLAALAHTGTQPEFFVQRIPKERLPKGFPQSVPMLRVVFPQRVFFDTAQSSLRPEGREVVRIVAESLSGDVPDVTMFVAGHTDPRGGRDYNQNLSVDRANTVATEILRQGVNLTTIWRIGFGSDMPLVPNTGPEAWGYNRRVEFLFAGKPEAIAIWLADMQVDGLCSGATSSETDRCKRALVMRRDYAAVPLVKTSTHVLPTPEPGKAVDGGLGGATVAAPKSGLQTIVPDIGRTIIINPVVRTVVLVSPSLGEKQ